MDRSEIDLFGKFTSIKTTAVDTYNDIMDGLTEKAVEHPATFQLVLGVAVTALLGGLAVAAVGVAAGLTGGLALAVMAGAAGFARAAVEMGIYTATSFLTDTVTGSRRSSEDYVKGLALSGGFGFVTGALSYLNPTISFTPGPSLAMAGGGTMAAAIPTIVTNVADTVLVLDKALAVSTVLSAALGAGGGEPDKEGIQIENEAASSKKLGKNMEKAGIPKPDFAYAAHHIVAGADKKAKEARDILKKFGIGINDAVNGVFLPTVKDLAQEVSEALYHPSLHTNKYYETINELLREATSREEVIEILKDIMEQLMDGTFMK